MIDQPIVIIIGNTSHLNALGNVVAAANGTATIAKIVEPNLKAIEKILVHYALHVTRNRVSKASKLLGIGRATLYRRLGEMGRG